MIPQGFIKSNLLGMWIVAPEIVLTLAILVLLAASVFLRHHRHRPFFTWLGLAGLAAALVPLATKLPMVPSGEAVLSSLFVWDEVTVIFKVFMVLTAAACICLAHDSAEIEDSHYSEAIILILGVTVANMMLIASNDLLMVFLAFETMSILCYLLVGLKASRPPGGEAALKYVLYGAFTSGVMLFGFSLLFGLAGTTDIQHIARYVAQAADRPSNQLLLVLSMIFFLAGMLFKIASFPFHFWCPDVYQGAPTPVTAFLSVGPKAAGFILFIRLFLPIFSKAGDTSTFTGLPGIEWPYLMALLSAATMTLGNLAALRQNNLKRMLAYSSIAHAGYLLMGLAAASGQGLRAMAFYLVIYLFMNLGAFGVVSLLASNKVGEEIEGYQGLGPTAPLLGVVMSVFLFSLIGLPPTGGFIGKVYLFGAVIEKGIYWLAVVAAVNTVVSLYFYLRIIKAMFLVQGPKQTVALELPRASHAMLTVMAGLVILLGVYWQPLALLIARIP